MMTEAERQSRARQSKFRRELVDLMNAHFAKGLTLQEAGVVMAADLVSTLTALNELKISPDGTLDRTLYGPKGDIQET